MDTTDAIGIAGALMVVGGAAWWHYPAGVAALGALLLGAAIVRSRRGEG